MALYFLDSSAVVKAYVSEVGSAWVVGLIDPTVGHNIYVAEITGVEVVSAITRQSRSGALSAVDAAKAHWIVSSPSFGGSAVICGFPLTTFKDGVKVRDSILYSIC